jgi:hypothetical protein
MTVVSWKRLLCGKSDEDETVGFLKGFLCATILDARFWTQRPTEIPRVDQDFRYQSLRSALKGRDSCSRDTIQHFHASPKGCN